MTAGEELVARAKRHAQRGSDAVDAGEFTMAAHWFDMAGRSLWQCVNWQAAEDEAKRIRNEQVVAS